MAVVFWLIARGRREFPVVKFGQSVIKYLKVFSFVLK